MSVGRMIARAAVSAAASLALVTGAGAGTVAVAAEPTAAQQCQVETQEVRDARQKVKRLKKKLRRAKRALANAKGPAAERKAKKKVKRFKKRLRRAKADLRTQRAEKTEWCDKAEQEQADHAAALAAAMEELNKRITEFTAMETSGDVETLPSEVSGPMADAFGELLTHLESLKTQLPEADVAQLQAALAMLQGLDPAQLQVAITGLADEIRNSGDASALQTLIDGLIGGLPGADAGGMEEVQAAFEALVAQLQAFDPQTAASDLPLIKDAVAAALEALQNHSTMSQDLIAALTTLNGGTMPSDPNVVAELLGGLAELNGGVLPTDPTTLTGLVDDVIGGLPLPLPDPGDLPLPLPLPDPGDLLDPVLDIFPRA